VKVQKPWIAVQMPYDLLCYRTMVYVLDWYFELPMFWTTHAVIKSTSAEADFVNEAKNSERAAAAWASSLFKDTVYVPKVYWDRTARHTMTQEWVEGCKINELAKMRTAGFDEKEVAETMIGVFAHQIFHSGFVHGDPHPGNMFVRRAPEGKQMQLVVLDHGMYYECSDKFRNSYAKLWKAMVLGDMEVMREVCESWGVADPELFATFQLFKPFSAKKSAALQNTTKTDMLNHAVEMRTKGYDAAKSMLKDAAKTPQELVIVGRHMNIVRANNAAMGAKANRVVTLLSQLFVHFCRHIHIHTHTHAHIDTH
jgi:aarF domain-containing kinase